MCDCDRIKNIKCDLDNESREDLIKIIRYLDNEVTHKIYMTERLGDIIYDLKNENKNKVEV